MIINNLKRILKDNEAALIISEKNRKYFTSFNSSEGFLVITKNSSCLFLDFRYIEAGEKQAQNCEVVGYKNLMSEISQLLKEDNADTLFVETDFITLDKFNALKDKLSQSKITVSNDNKLSQEIKKLRSIKSSDEIEKIKTAQKITEESFLEVLNYIKPGVSENKIALELEYLMKKRGAEAVAFDLITITGQKTSLPHGVPSDDLIKSGDFFTMDIGAVYDGYCSDMTRTIAVGEISDKQKDIYDIVLKAQLNALKNIKSGVKCSFVDKCARDIITNEGYSQCFGHSTGHGVGLDIHEFPTVGPNSDTLLTENMVITVEPGIYLPKQFGVRIEDMVYVTKDGHFNFTNIKKDLIIV